MGEYLDITKVKMMKDKLSTALISDVLDEMGYQQQMMPIEIKPNFLEARIFGRARTMTLKPLEHGENYLDVYKGLYFVERLNKGDVLVVANAFPNYAFFGELMSTLAKYRGVDGVIVDGCTRDYVETVKMGYPVFSKTHFARDIKKRGIVDKLDEQVKVGDVLLTKEDLIFGDHDGIIVIPKIIETEVLAKCVKVANLETAIKSDILSGVSVDRILKEVSAKTIANPILESVQYKKDGTVSVSLTFIPIF